VGFTGSIVRNTLVDWIRKHGKGGAADGPSDREVADRQLESLEATTSRPDPDVLMDLGKAVTALPEVQRRVVTALYLEGRSYEEASQDLGLPLGTLKRHQTQGLKALREGLLCTGSSP
jgi:RNA polymerase sigma-70 factor (ECF subfamily)